MGEAKNIYFTCLKKENTYYEEEDRQDDDHQNQRGQGAVQAA